LKKREDEREREKKSGLGVYSRLSDCCNMDSNKIAKRLREKI
jgi:hypothetical protein